MFMGEYNHNVDAKGRLILPANFREELGSSFVVTRGLDGCLFVFSQLEWQAFDEKLQSLPLINKGSRELNRFFHAGVTPCDPDKQGRVLIPSSLRDFAGITKEVVAVGMGKRIEIWSKERWEETIAATNEEMDGVLDQMQEFGFTI